MTSIPYDPSLVLGQIVDIKRIELLAQEAEITNPVEVAREKLRNLSRSYMKIKLLYQEMLKMFSLVEMAKLYAQMILSRHFVQTAAVELAQETVKAQEKLPKLRLQKSKLFDPFGVKPESPIDLALSSVDGYNLGYDSIKFDVQYFAMEGSMDISVAMDKQSQGTGENPLDKALSDMAGGAGGMGGIGDMIGGGQGGGGGGGGGGGIGDALGGIAGGGGGGGGGGIGDALGGIAGGGGSGGGGGGDKGGGGKGGEGGKQGYKEMAKDAAKEEGKRAAMDALGLTGFSLAGNMEKHFGDFAKIATDVSKFVKDSTPDSHSGGDDLARNSHTSMVSQTSRHNVEGTIVIVAHCTHKKALMIDPFVLDPVLAVAAWNQTFSSDKVRTDPISLSAALLKPALPTDKTMELLSGCTLGSSFVGFVHILREEGTQSSQNSKVVASAVKESLEQDMAVASMTGQMGTSSSLVAENAKSFLSTSLLQNHAGLVCRGLIPSLKYSTVKTKVDALKETPQERMKTLETFTSEQNPSANSKESLAARATQGQQFMELNTSGVPAQVASLDKAYTSQSQVIDTNAMLTCFKDYVDRCSDDAGGVPINFFLKSIRKSDVAKAYIKRFYPRGLDVPEDVIKGTIGIE